jgi:type VI secretion system protein ImpJ
MSWNNKVIWSEGLFLRPQHFQQQDRFLEQLVEQRAGRLRSYAWGFTALKLDQDLLQIGKLAIASARGVFADGTPFNIPDNDDLPAPLEVGEAHRGARVYLSLATRQPGVPDLADGGPDAEGLARYQIREYDARDTSAMTDTRALMQVGSLRLKLLVEKDQRAEYTGLGIAQIIEARADKRVLLEDSYLPPVLDVQASGRLAGFVSELQGLFHHRGEALAALVSGPGKGGVAEVTDFLLLQLVNRYEPLVTHLAAGHLLHPEDLYRLLLEIAGELSSFSTATKRPGQFATYRHDDLDATFQPVMASIRESLSMVLQTSAVPIPLQERRYGIKVGRVPDQSLLDSARFVLAVTAQMPVEELWAKLPRQIKIGSVEIIQQLVNTQLPGIHIRPLTVAPRQIPFHAGNTYFELDRTSEHWASLKQSAAFAMHVGGTVPGLTLEFWAIRG